MRGNTHGEMKDRKPAPNAANSETSGTSANVRLHLTSRSGITSARGRGPNSTPNLIGGRSWNMKSHFQRSDGFDVCSQPRCDIGRANLIESSVSYPGIAKTLAARFSRIAAALA